MTAPKRCWSSTWTSVASAVMVAGVNLRSMRVPVVEVLPDADGSTSSCTGLVVVLAAGTPMMRRPLLLFLWWDFYPERQAQCCQSYISPPVRTRARGRLKIELAGDRLKSEPTISATTILRRLISVPARTRMRARRLPKIGAAGFRLKFVAGYRPRRIAFADSRTYHAYQNPKIS
jgi:hypothetical protein